MKTEVFSFHLIRILVCLVSVFTLAAGFSSSSARAQAALGNDADTSNSILTIEQLSPYVVANTPISLWISTKSAATTVRIDILSATNTRSELYDFVDHLGDRRVKSSVEIPFDNFLPDASTPNLYRADIPINTEGAQLRLSSNGVYPIAISLMSDGQKTATEYSFITYVSSVSTTNSAFAYKLNVVPLVQYSPLIDRSRIKDSQSKLTTYGISNEQRIIEAQSTLQAIDSLAPHGVVLSPELFDTYSYMLGASNSEIQNESFVGAAGAGSLSENITDTYSPMNIAELEKIHSTSQFAAQLSLGRSIVTTAGLTASSRTLVTESITHDTIDDVAQSGIDNIIVNEKTFARELRPSSLPARISSEDSSLRVASADSGIVDHLSSSLSASSQANYLVAATSVIALESPSIQRSVIVPLPLEQLDALTLQQFFLSNTTSPLIKFISPQSFFAQDIDSTLTRKLERSNFGFAGDHKLSIEEITSIDRVASGVASMLDTNSDLGLQAFWMRRVIFSRSQRAVEKIVNKATADGLIEQIKKQIALPEKRTLTITSRENSIPVTIRNTSGSTVKVIVMLSSDKLAFPNGTRFTTTLDQENTTIRVPVRARTSGSFPITISVVTPSDSIEIVSQNATVRSTAVSGAGLTIAIASTAFLALWWISHARKNKKRPIAPVIELPHEEAG